MKKTAYRTPGGFALANYRQVLNLPLLLFVFIVSWSSLSFGEVTIKWFGHSCFLIESSQGTKILTDPLGEETGYPLPEVMPDIITISHEHFDHNYVRPYRSRPKVIRGLTTDGKDWERIEETVKDVTISNVFTYHDNKGGKKDGPNSIFVFQLEGLRIVHTGDLGHLLSEEQIKALGQIDVLLIPIGGVTTISPFEANEVLEQLRPKIAIPMHYKTPVCTFTLYSTKHFIKDKTNVRKVGSNTLSLSKGSLPNSPEIVILDYE
ncbi:MAG TPA: MBL fold metallo-hydrolase [Candidatus Brocadiales bacterium]|nr:MBL fold metallo-hydrolase [Candidatus Brocadiales bacterium]